MADEFDRTQEELERRYDVAAKNRAPYHLPAGTPGECERCERESHRLINDLCGACRDELRIK